VVRQRLSYDGLRGETLRGRLLKSVLIGPFSAYGPQVPGRAARDRVPDRSGGGSAGWRCFAARLSEAGSRGLAWSRPAPNYGPYDGVALAQRDILDGPASSPSPRVETEREDRSQLRARIMGGCSAHNACVIPRRAPPRRNYDEVGRGVEPRDDRALPRSAAEA